MAKTQKNKHKSRIRQRKSRRVIGSRGYKNYSEEMLQLACEAVSSNQISSRDAERQFGIPRRTIVKKIKKLHSKSVGHPTHLTEEEENRIVRVLQASSDFGYPLTKLDLKLIVSEYLKKNSREHLFKNKIPGDAWVQSFLARHADTLSVRMTQNISKARAEKGPQEIADYFANLSITLKDIPATNIINFDETNLSDDPGSSKCIFRRGVRYPERIANSTKGNISVMFTAIASGQSLPLYVVYKATNLYSEWITGGPPSTRYNFTKSGWFDSATFEDYFEKIIIPWAHETPGTKVVICDNLSSHLSVKVIELCDQYNIKFVFIPPRSTHLTQPLDVTYFGPLKKAWRRILYQYKLKNPNQTSLNKKHFPKLLTELIEAIMLNKDKNIKSGFKATGIFPLNPQEVLKKLPEMQEDILSYGLDQTLIEYLKETRAPKPMAVKRNKKVKCEPGKSVTAADLHIIKICSKKGTLKSNGNKQNKNNLPEVIITQNQSVLNLDDQTGIFTNNNLSPNYINTDRDQNFEIQNLNDLILFNNYNGFQPLEEININSEKSNWPNVYEHSTLTLKSPKTLIQYCIEALNSVLYQSMTQVPEPKLLSKINDNFPNYTRQIEPTAGTSGVFIKKTKPKINIISNVLIKTATQTSDVHYLSDVSNLEINTPFIVKANRGLPKCLQQGKPTKSEKTNNLNKSNPKRMRINSKNKLQNSKGGKKKKLKKKQSICDSSSTSANSTIKLIDTDDSDCETLQSYYISECLKDQEEKENFEDTEIPFGLSDIQYLDDRGELNEGNWIVARFATKKSLKHFVGKILSVSDKKPMVKFVRKVKQSKCDKGTSFTYPTVDDVCIIHYLEDVISVLPEPTISRRGQIIFNVDFSNLNIQ